MKLTQFSIPLFLVVLFLTAGQVTLMASGHGAKGPVWIPLVIIAVVIVLFYKLQVDIDKSDIRISFGVGLISDKFPIDSIASVTSVRNSFLMGWGIRMNSSYTLYNASGFGAIELRFKDRSKRVRIGVKNPEEVARYISSLLTT